MDPTLTDPLRVVVALDSFKGSLGSAAAGAAVRDGVLDSAPAASVRVLPVADGGEGTLDALTAALPATRIESATVDALGRPLRADYIVLDTDGVAVIEAARTVGLERLDVIDASIPPRASSTGLGDQIRHALRHTDKSVLVGLGGSASTDGGTGMLRALGADIGSDPGSRGNPLWSFDSLDVETLPDLSRVVVLSDVTNPLLGRSGAARVFGPQKGATPDQVEHLEDRMRLWAAALAATGHDLGDCPGAGAAGGLGAALIACGAKLVPGFTEVARRAGLPDAIGSADLVITGEGSLDAQTAMGKAPLGVARLARAAGAIAVGLGGRVERPGVEPFDAVFSINSAPRALVEALDPDLTAAELRATAAELVRLVVRVRRGGGEARASIHSRH